MRVRPVLVAPLLALLALLPMTAGGGAGVTAGAEASSYCPNGTPPPRGGANPTATANPLDDGPWAAGHGRAEEVWRAYCDPATTAAQKALLAKIALQPRMLWFGHWFSPSEIRSRISEYITAAQAGNPRVIVHLAVFRLWPREEAGRDIPLTRAEQRAYRTWVDNAAAAIGRARVAMVLEPDIGIAAYDSADPGVRLGLARYAAQKFGSLANTSVYIDASSADWLRADRAVLMLRRAGVRYTRGFALGATHYTRLAPEIDYARRLSRGLAAAGIPGKKAVIDTSDNTRGFTYAQYYAKHPRGWFDNAEICRSTSEARCVTLGIPPTWRVAGWGLGPTMRTYARRYVDGYTWFGRSWQYAQSAPFKLNRALGMARTSPWQ